VRVVLIVGLVALVLGLPLRASAFTGDQVTIEGSRSATTIWTLKHAVEIPFTGDGGNFGSCQSSHHRVHMAAHFVGVMLRDRTGRVIFTAFAIRGVGLFGSPAECPRVYFASQGGRLFRLDPGRYRLTLSTDGPASFTFLGVRGIPEPVRLHPVAPARPANTGWRQTTLPTSQEATRLRVNPRTFGLAIVDSRTGLIGGPGVMTSCLQPAEGDGCGLIDPRAEVFSYGLMSLFDGEATTNVRIQPPFTPSGQDILRLTNTVTATTSITTYFHYFADYD
jgi:hypothetical protein